MIFTKKKPLGILFFLLAVIVGLSRIYLSQHFFMDIYFGSIVGVVITSILYVAIRNLYKFRVPGPLHKSLIDMPVFSKIRGNVLR